MPRGECDSCHSYQSLISSGYIIQSHQGPQPWPTITIILFTKILLWLNSCWSIFFPAFILRNWNCTRNISIDEIFFAPPKYFCATGIPFVPLKYLLFHWNICCSTEIFFVPLKYFLFHRNIFSSCFCSGVSTDCRSSSSHYWSTLRVGGSDLVAELVVVDRSADSPNIFVLFSKIFSGRARTRGWGSSTTLSVRQWNTQSVRSCDSSSFMP